MHPIVYFILVFLLAGGIGMALGSRGASGDVKRQRWLKYVAYIFITGTIILGMFFHFFTWLACLLILAGLAELIRVSGPVAAFDRLQAALVFLLIASGFILFAWSFGKDFLLFIYFQVLVFDGFCQVSGQLWGRRLLAPSISPGKTVEGFLGGWVAGIIAGICASSWLQTDIPGWQAGMLYGFMTGIFSLAGDLLASAYKRKAGVKDYSNWLPGQGGVLDRFDSFLFTGAAYYLLGCVIFRQSFLKFMT